MKYWEPYFGTVLEKLNTLGSQGDYLADVKKVIARVGKPEDFGTTDEEKLQQIILLLIPILPGAGYRNPDDKLLGGVLEWTGC